MSLTGPSLPSLVMPHLSSFVTVMLFGFLETFVLSNIRGFPSLSVLCSYRHKSEDKLIHVKDQVRIGPDMSQVFEEEYIFSKPGVSNVPAVGY